MRKWISTVLALSILIMLFQSCKNAFDEKKAKQMVSLSSEDLKLYDAFYKLIVEDLVVIRNKMKPLSSGDTTLLGTNSYYLYQIDSAKYSSIISELKRREIFTDNIETSPSGMIVFRLKDISNINWGDYNDSYIHEIVYNYNKAEYLYSQMNIIVDSVIEKNTRYIYFTAKTGH